MNQARDDSEPGGFVTAVLEAGANRVLRLDPLALEQLANLDGSLIRLELTDLGLGLDAVPSASGLRLSPAGTRPADVTLRGAFRSFARLMLGAGSLVPGTIEIAGNMDLGRRFQEVMRGLEPEWEEALARVTGDVLAHHLGKLARVSGAWAKTAAREFRLDTTEILQEELRILPNRHESEQLLGAIDVLRADVDRLEARVRRLGP
jgi:ubiquinone biosynthesis protein UbiJ